MSSSRRPSSPATANPTRQMLDELDALMERMLSLPVEDPDAALPEPPQSLLVEDPPPPELEEPTPALGEAAPTVEEAASLLIEAETDWQPTPPASAPPLQGPHHWPVPGGKIIVGRLSAPPLHAPPPEPDALEFKSQANEPANEQPLGTPMDDLPPLIVKPAGLRTAQELKAKIPVRRRSWRQTSYQLLLGFNQAFDRATTWLGNFGMRLRSTRGRHVLGITGAALLALAILWCLHDWLGWNWFKVSLE